eukprot:m.54821 g.54821  ORF g.54821 m.54821 type:complete len:622 (-) comp6622_c0_seq1:204-2069(-)
MNTAPSVAELPAVLPAASEAHRSKRIGSASIDEAPHKSAAACLGEALTPVQIASGLPSRALGGPVVQPIAPAALPTWECLDEGVVVRDAIAFCAVCNEELRASHRAAIDHHMLTRRHATRKLALSFDTWHRTKVPTARDASRAEARLALEASIPPLEGVPPAEGSLSGEGTTQAAIQDNASVDPWKHLDLIKDDLRAIGQEIILGGVQTRMALVLDVARVPVGMDAFDVCVLIRFLNADGFHQQRVLSLDRWGPDHPIDLLFARVMHCLAEIGARPWNIASIICNVLAPGIPSAITRLGTLMDDVEVICSLPHAIGMAGSLLETPLLTLFINSFQKFLIATAEAATAWAAMAAPTPNPLTTPWHPMWALISRIYVHFTEMPNFLSRFEHIVHSGRQTCADILTVHRASLAMQLSAVVDLGRVLVDVCEAVRGEDFIAPLASDAFERLDVFLAQCLDSARPVTTPLARSLSHAVAATEQARTAEQTRTTERSLVIEAIACVQRPFEWLARELRTGILLRSRVLFLACRLCNPHRLNSIPVDDTEPLLREFKCLHHAPDRIRELLDELPLYRSMAGLCRTDDLLTWWKDNQRALPAWARLAFEAALFQPAITSVEDVLMTADS